MIGGDVLMAVLASALVAYGSRPAWGALCLAVCLALLVRGRRR